MIDLPVMAGLWVLKTDFYLICLILRLIEEKVLFYCLIILLFLGDLY